MLNSYQKQFVFGLLIATLLLGNVIACAMGPDVEYIITNDADADPAAALAACQAQRFVTLDCIELLAEDADRTIEEQAAVRQANQELNDMLDCYTYEIVVAEETEEVAADDIEGSDAETTTASTGCESVATNLLAGFDVCVSLAEDAKYFECKDIEEAVNDAVSMCDASSEDITVDFCSLINPTTDTD